MHGAVRGADDAILLSICTVFGDGIAVIACFARPYDAITADLESTGLGTSVASIAFFFGIDDAIATDAHGTRLASAVGGTDRTAGLTIVAGFGDRIAIVAFFVSFGDVIATDIGTGACAHGDGGCGFDAVATNDFPTVRGRFHLVADHGGAVHTAHVLLVQVPRPALIGE